jgi:hypothetical protein
MGLEILKMAAASHGLASLIAFVLPALQRSARNGDSGLVASEERSRTEAIDGLRCTFLKLASS